MADGITIGGQQVISGRLIVPQVGPWHAELDLSADDDAIPEGETSLVFGDSVTWSGYVRRGGSDHERGKVRIVGGKGGLHTELDARSYRGVPLSLVLSDLARDAGETLASDLDSDLTGYVFTALARTKASMSQTLPGLIETLGATWRVLADGTVWVGEDAWETAEIDHVELDRNDARGIIEIAPEQPDLVPGVTFLGERVICVVYEFDAEKLRAKVWTDGGGLDSDLAQELGRIIHHFTLPSRYHAVYPARVHSQDDDGSLQVFPDVDTIPPMVGVPLRVGAPGIEVEVLQGCRVLVSFENGDPRYPIALLSERDASKMAAIRVTAQTEITVNGPNVRIGNDGGEVNLGDTPANGVARVGDIVEISIATVVDGVTPPILLSNSGGPCVGTIGTPVLPWVVVGQIITCKESVKA